MMKREITMSYHWDCEALPVEIPFAMAEILEEHTYDRVYLMVKDGYSAGELCCYARTDIEGYETPEDGWECHGWWAKREACL